jgi:hypothetical protein
MTKAQPSDIILDDIMPLAGCFETSALDAAAAWIVLACQKHGDFKPRSFLEIAEAVGHDRPDWALLFLGTPDFHGLVQHGYAQVVDEERLKFTELGRSRLSMLIQKA